MYFKNIALDSQQKIKRGYSRAIPKLRTDDIIEKVQKRPPENILKYLKIFLALQVESRKTQ